MTFATVQDGVVLVVSTSALISCVRGLQMQRRRLREARAAERNALRMYGESFEMVSQQRDRAIATRMIEERIWWEYRKARRG